MQQGRCQSLKVENCFIWLNHLLMELFWTITFVKSNMLLRLEPFQMFVQVKIELGLASILVSNDVCERMSKVVTQNFHHDRKKMD